MRQQALDFNVNLAEVHQAAATLVSGWIDRELGLATYGGQLLTRGIVKTLGQQEGGALSPAVLPALLLGGEAGTWLSGVCALFHMAADLADDVADQDLGSTWQDDGPGQAVNTSNGLLFLQQNVILQEAPHMAVRLLAVFAEAGWRMHEGQRCDLHLTNGLTPFPHRQVAELKAGSEIGAFATACAVVQGWPEDPCRRFGVALGALMQIYSDHVDVWLSPESSDLVAGKLTAPVQAGLLEPGFARLMAGSRRHPDRQRVIRQSLLESQAIAWLEEDLAHYRSQWQAAMRELPVLERLRPLCLTIEEGVTDLLQGLKELKQAMQTIKRPEVARSPKQAEAQARGFLLADRSHRESWEVHRWGFMGRPYVKGDVFQVAVIADVLRQVGEDISPELGHLLGRRSPDGWRYYPDEAGIPTDADDLGQLLQLFARTCESHQLVRWFGEPVNLLMTNLGEQGEVPTWLVRGTPYECASLPWPEDLCDGVAANAYFGLLHYPPSGFAPFLDRGASYLLDRQADEKGWDGYYYGRCYTTYVVARFLHAWSRQTNDMSLARRCSEALAQLADTWRQRQRLDGGWGSPQDTALVLALLLQGGGMAAERIQAALQYLTDTQLADGGWPAEPFYLCPGLGSDTQSVSREVTTAFCLKALHLGRRSGRKRRGTQPL